MKTHTTLIGICNVFLLGPVNNNYLLIDSGNRGKMKGFLKRLHAWGIHPHQITHILITHAHHDHTGNVYEIQQATRAKVIIHQLEKQALIAGKYNIPKGFNILGKFISGLGHLFLNGKNAFHPVTPDIVLTDSIIDLQDFGFPAIVIHTPGHTSGSVSVVDLQSNRAYVGDLMFNIKLLTQGQHHPPFADIPIEVIKSWDKLLQYPINFFYPAHGNRIPRKSIEAEYNKRLA